MRATEHTGPACRLCGVATAQHAPCAVCFSTNAHTRLCPFCRAQHEIYGIEWSEEDAGNGLAGELAGAGDGRHLAAIPLAELAGRQRRRGGDKLQRVLRLLLEREELAPVRRSDSRGHSRGSYLRRRFLSRRDIARRAGCSHTYVNRVYRLHVIRAIE
jgi:hypothetical protein